MLRMSDKWLKRVTVRPINGASEIMQYQALMEQHHYLGWCTPVGARILYVAEVDGEWVALITWAAAALKVGARDRWLGCRLHTNPEKLRCIVNNTRFLVLPHARRPHLASRVLGLSCKRLCSDWIARYGHRVLIAETFVDPRFSGTCYRAAGWHNLGLTRGWKRSSQGYSEHGIAKSVWVKELCHDARSLFLAPYALSCFTPGGNMPTIDINALPIGTLMELIGKKLSDPRQAIGKRFRLDSVVTLIVLGNLCGFPCIAHIAEWATKLSREVRTKLKLKGPKVPSHTTLHRVSKMVDVNEFLDAARAFQRKNSGRLTGVGVAIDGKTIRGAKDDTGKAPHILSAIRHDNRLPISQCTVPEKANEITALKPMIEELDLSGAMITIDAMHTNQTTAEYITDGKDADYMLTLKDNQPTLLADVKRLFSEGAFSPSVQRTSDKGSR